MTVARSLQLILTALGLMLCGAQSHNEIVLLTPIPALETDPVPSDGDAADDPAIWIHPDDPARSLVIATNKKGGLHAYSLDGKERQRISGDSRPNNVDLVYGFPIAGGKTDLAIASVGKGGKSVGVKVWTIDRADGSLAELGEGVTFTTFNGGLPYGICTYRSPRDSSLYVFVTDRDGAVEQYRIDPETEQGRSLKATRVRGFRVGSQAEGIVADRERARLYIGEEDVGIWEYGAEPGDGPDRRVVAKVGEHGLMADVEGLAIYYAGGGKGYLLASSQGNNTVNVYERSGDHAYVATIDPRTNTTDDVLETDGLEVTNQPTSTRFPRGFLVMQDGKNDGRQNFKLFSWEDVAANRLLIDTSPTTR